MKAEYLGGDTDALLSVYYLNVCILFFIAIFRLLTGLILILRLLHGSLCLFTSLILNF